MGRIFRIEGGEPLRLSDNALVALHIDARTEDGRYIIGNPGEPITVSLAEDTNLRMTELDGNPLDSDEVPGIFIEGRSIWMLTSGPTTETMEVSWAGHTITIEVVVQ